jgi:hypothetical protein
MEINSNPSFNMFLERDLPNGEVEKTLSELDRFVKSKVVGEAIRLVTGHGNDDDEGLFEQVLPCQDEDMDRFSIWNGAQELFELLLGANTK